MASCNVQESKEKRFQKLHVLGMNDDLWDRVRGSVRKDSMKKITP